METCEAHNLSLAFESPSATMDVTREALIYAYNKGYRINNNGDAINPGGKKLKARITGDGYLAIGIRYNGSVYSVPCHRLMAYQKYGDLLFEADCVRHLNRNQFDNSCLNIEIGTNSENQLDVPREIRVAAAEKATPIKYNNVKDIREYYAQCGSYKDTMEKFGITSKGTLYYILKERKLLSK